MPSRFDKYRVKDGLTKLGEAFFNPVFGDIDLRLVALEQVKITWEDAVDALTQYGLARINDALLPALDNMAVIVDEKSAEIEAKRLAAIAAVEELQLSIDTLQASADADIAAWIAVKQAEFDSWIASLETGGYVKASDIGVLIQPYDADLTAWAGKTAPEGAAVGTIDQQTLTNKTLTGAMETRVAMSGGAVDLKTGNYFTKTIVASTTFTVSNVPTAGTTACFVLELTNGGAANVTWWTGVKWAAGTAPTLTASGVDVLSFYSHDGGTTWRGAVIAKDSK